MYGEMIPIGGGDTIPLIKKNLMVGRRESCDIVLRFANVSAHHCQLSLENGYWYAEDLNSRNGVKVNGKRIAAKKRIDPGDTLAVAKHQYEFTYSPAELGAVGPPPPEDSEADSILGASLLERAGLQRKKAPGSKYKKRYDLGNDSGGRFKDPNEPI